LLHASIAPLELGKIAIILFVNTLAAIPLFHFRVLVRLTVAGSLPVAVVMYW